MAVIHRRTATPAALLVAALGVSSIAPAAQTTIAISTAASPATPRIQAPLTFAAFPNSAFVFAIPATGQAPLSYSATGLPSGLSLAADTGVISGTMPAAGSYPVNVKVTNAAGNASATLTLVAGNTLSLTPPVGWNSYDSFGASVTESDMLEQAKALKSRLQPYGWNYVVIDYRWYEPGLPIDANGRYLPATSKYPSATGSNGFKSLADKIHATGLGFGIHIMRGIPRKSYDANTPIANSTFKAKDAGNASDPCPWDQHMWGVRGDTTAGQDWYNSLFEQYAAWGVDFIKIDDMLNNDTRTYHQAEVDAIRKAIDKCGRSIVLSLSPGPNDPAWFSSSASHLATNANMWRAVNDFWDYSALTDLPGVFTAASTWQDVTGLGAGHWPDLDMLPLGYLGPRNEWHASGQTTFSKNEQVTIMSLWGIMPSPLMFGGNVVSLSTDDWTTALLTNEEVMAVNQDPSGTHGKRIAQQGSTEVWTRDLSGGRKAVALFNRGTQDATVSASFSQLGMTGTPTVRDLWHRSDVTGITNSLSVTVPYSGALMYTLTPAEAGTGGGSGTGGATGTGGASTSGGSTAAAGSTMGGAATGGAATGGRSSGGQATGGLSTGGTQLGGKSAGGAATGGNATGGNASGGATTTPIGGTTMAPTGGAAPSASGGSTTTTGGSSALGTGSSAQSVGGAANAGGALGSSGAVDAAGAAPGEADGCSCRIAGTPAESKSWAGLGLLGLALLGRRRRGRLV